MVCKLFISWATVREFIKQRHSPRSMEIRPVLLPRVQHFNLFHSWAAHLQLKHSSVTAAARPSSPTSTQVWWHLRNYGVLICVCLDFGNLSRSIFQAATFLDQKGCSFRPHHTSNYHLWSDMWVSSIMASVSFQFSLDGNDIVWLWQLLSEYAKLTCK